MEKFLGGFSRRLFGDLMHRMLQVLTHYVLIIHLSSCRISNEINSQPCGGTGLHKTQAHGLSPQSLHDAKLGMKCAQYKHRESKYGCLVLSSANERMRNYPVQHHGLHRAKSCA